MGFPNWSGLCAYYGMQSHLDKGDIGSSVYSDLLDSQISSISLSDMGVISLMYTSEAL